MRRDDEVNWLGRGPVEKNLDTICSSFPRSEIKAPKRGSNPSMDQRSLSCAALCLTFAACSESNEPGLTESEESSSTERINSENPPTFGGTSGGASGTGGFTSGNPAAGGAASVGGSEIGSGGSGTGGADIQNGTGGGSSDVTCPLPTSLQWTSSGVLAEPAEDGWFALKDFTVTRYNGKYIVYGTVANGNWNGFFSTFSSFEEWDTAEQHYHSGHVAPTLFYFSPKNIWVLTYQWGFQYKTTQTPDVWSSWSAGQSLMNYNPDPTGGAGTGPIDQTVICDDSDCYLFFNDDAGGVYRASMPIGNFPGQFTGAQKIMQESTGIVFEGIQVYSIKGSDKYLMIIENNGRRAFRAWTTDSLGGTFTALGGANTTDSPFAGEKNVTWPGGQWTTDISHGDIVRENPSEKMEIDPCHLQLLYQGKGDVPGTPYGELAYRPGLLTLSN